MQRQLTHKKDKFDSRDHLLMPSLAALPKWYSMADTLGPVRDQGSAGSCTGQATAGFLDVLYKQQIQHFMGRLAPGDYFSALQIYAEERIMTGDFPTDTGSDSRTAFRVLQQIGACPNSVMPYNDQNIAVTPDALQLAAATNFKVGAYHRVLLDADLTGFRSCLASNYCRIIGIPVYTGIESEECAVTGILPIPKQTDTPIGGHELLAYGYNDDEQVELIRNSWGVNWGVQGNFKIPYKYYAAVGGNDAMDSWVAHMGKPWVPKQLARNQARN